jgi:hypothetical protein
MEFKLLLEKTPRKDAKKRRREKTPRKDAEKRRREKTAHDRRRCKVKKNVSKSEKVRWKK